MIRTTTKARRPAALVVKPPFHRTSIPRILSSSPAPSRFFCAFVKNSRLKGVFEKHKAVQQRLSASQTVRYCSHRRAMCRKTTDMQGGSVDVETSREVLPTNVKPLHYALTLEPNFEKFSYEGTVVIEYVR